jgi:two-component system KDP operon response regulator KdpE
MQYKKTILLIEEEVGMVDFLTAMLTANDYKVVTAVNGKDALHMRLSHNPDLILLDFGLSNMSGQDILRETRAQCEVPIIVISARQSEKEKVMALESGANDYLVRPFAHSELLVRIRNTIRLRESVAYAAGTEEKDFCYMGFRIDYSSYRITVDDIAVHLTPIEYKIVELLSRHAGRALTHEQIINHVWGPNNCENQVLRVNMANIRRKIEDDPAAPQIILTELGIGYRMQTEEAPVVVRG